MSTNFKIKNSWVFNSKLDIISFLLPFLVAIFFMGTKYNSVNNYWASYFLAKIFIGGGHIFATYIPIMVTNKVKARFNSRLYIMPVIFVSVYAVANFISDVAFMNLLAITGLFHIYLQHYAWLKMSQGQMAPKRKMFERNFFLILMGFPNIIWFLRQLDNGPSYLYGITITQAIPNFNIFTFPVLIIFTIVCALISLALAFSKDEKGDINFNFARLIFFMSTTVWMCFGLFFIKSLGFFHVYLAIAHGTSYMAYISESWPKHLENGVWASNYRFLIVCLTAVLFGWLWLISFRLFKWTPSYLIFLPWIPLLVHYSLDSTIWRKTKVII